SLNGDDDSDDDVLQVYDAKSGLLINTEQAVTPCRLEACDPSIPYQVLDHTVRFLTYECDQGGPVTNGCPTGGTDLNGDGDAADLVLQVFNVARAAHEGAAKRASYAVASMPIGLCTFTGRPCVRDTDCADGGTCFVPQGGCAVQLESCDPRLPNGC